MLRFGSVTGFFKPAPSPKPRQNSKIRAPGWLQFLFKRSSDCGCAASRDVSRSALTEHPLADFYKDLWICRLGERSDGVVVDAVDNAGAAIDDADEVVALGGELPGEVRTGAIGSRVADQATGI